MHPRIKSGCIILDMNEFEKKALQKLTTTLVEKLDPKIHVIDVIYSEDCLTDLEYESLLKVDNRAQQCRELLNIVRRNCPIRVFFKALCYNGAFTFLADKLKDTVSSLENGGKNEKLLPSRKRTVSDRELDDDYEDYEDKPTSKNVCPLCKCPPRINTTTPKKKLLTKMQQHLKYLCMDGNTADHNTFLEKLAQNWKGDADVKFVIHDAIARNIRVSSAEVSDESHAFRNMESLIPFTTDPTTSSMIFLARKASVYDLKGKAREGLTVLGYAKNHAERVVPCRDTGLVIYIEINLLLKEYEHEPSQGKKTEIIDRIKEAIEVHFSQEEDEVKDDCSRMLYVKLACFYLGLGLMGNKMAGCRVMTNDVKSAEVVLDRIESNWFNMDARRKMFYYLARAVLCQYRDQKEKALHFGEIAKHMAEKGQFRRELGNIEPLTRDLDVELKQVVNLKGDEILMEFNDLHKNGVAIREVL